MRHTTRYMLIFIVLALVGSTLAQPAIPAQALAPVLAAKVPPAIQGSLPASERVKLIVHFNEPPLALYSGGIQGLAATNPSLLGQSGLDLDSAASRAYLQHLARHHERFMQQVTQAVANPELLADYRVAFNGMALEVPTSEVEALLKLDGVRLLEVNQVEQLHTDSSPEFLGAPVFWEQLGAADGSTAGEGIVVGVIDTGIYNPSTMLTTTGIHPSLSDPAPVGGDYAATFPYKGVCAPANPQPQDGSFGSCNDKLIGAWWYNAGEIGNPGEMMSPMDEDGHGTHTATTAVGNGGVVTPRGTISGIAPRARLIAYKVCWSEDPSDPDDGGCATIDSVAAIEQAVIDDVDVINFSIGGGNSPWQSSVELAFLGAFEAGVIVNTSSGNSGVNTVEHESPWLMTVAASTQPRTFIGLLTLHGDTAVPGPFYGAGSSAGTVSGTLVLAPPQAANDQTPGLCLEPYPAGTFEPTDIVVCRRGGAFFVDKYAHVFAGGAGGVIVGNAETSPPPPSVDCAYVCVNLDYLSTEALIDYITSTLTATGTLQGGVPTIGNAGDQLASFSSTGPSDTLNVLKPDIAAIGVEVNAGITAFIWDAAFADGQLFGLKQGTSMASPHVAGASALLRQQHPDWSPAEIKSALQMTAHQTLFVPGVNRAATPFEQGSGRLQLSTAVSAGLTLDESSAHFLAANPAIGGDPRTLNIASLINQTCIETCSWTRTVRNVLDSSASWTASSVVTGGLGITVEPASFTLAAGATQTLTITANVAGAELDTWLFGQLVLSEASSQAPAAKLPVAVQSSLGELPERVEIVTMQETGTYTVPDILTVSSNDFTVQPYGLIEATQLYTTSLAQDSDTGDFLDDLNDGVWLVPMTVPTGTQRLVVEIVNTTSPDIDLFVLVDINNNGIPEQNEIAYTSASAATLEKVDVFDPYVGNYFIVVQNFAASDAGSDMVQLAYGAVPEAANGTLEVQAPAVATAGIPLDVQLQWNIPQLQAGDIWYGALGVGTSSATPDDIGRIAVDLRSFAQVYLPLVRR